MLPGSSAQLVVVCVSHILYLYLYCVNLYFIKHYINKCDLAISNSNKSQHVIESAKANGEISPVCPTSYFTNFNEMRNCKTICDPGAQKQS